MVSLFGPFKKLELLPWVVAEQSLTMATLGGAVHESRMRQARAQSGVAVLKQSQKSVCVYVYIYKHVMISIMFTSSVTLSLLV